MAHRVLLDDATPTATFEGDGRRVENLPLVTVPRGHDAARLLAGLREDAVALQEGEATAWARVDGVVHAGCSLYKETVRTSGARERVRVRVKEIRERRPDSDAGFFSRLLGRDR